MKVNWKMGDIMKCYVPEPQYKRPFEKAKSLHLKGIEYIDKKREIMGWELKEVYDKVENRLNIMAQKKLFVEGKEGLR